MSEQLAQTMTSPVPTREEVSLRVQTSSWTSKQHKKFPQLVPEFLRDGLNQQQVATSMQGAGPIYSGGKK